MEQRRILTKIGDWVIHDDTLYGHPIPVHQCKEGPKVCPDSLKKWEGTPKAFYNYAYDNSTNSYFCLNCYTIIPEEEHKTIRAMITLLSMSGINFR